MSEFREVIICPVRVGEPELIAGFWTTFNPPVQISQETVDRAFASPPANETAEEQSPSFHFRANSVVGPPDNPSIISELQESLPGDYNVYGSSEMQDMTNKVTTALGSIGVRASAFVLDHPRHIGEMVSEVMQPPEFRE